MKNFIVLILTLSFLSAGCLREKKAVRPKPKKNCNTVLYKILMHYQDAYYTLRTVTKKRHIVSRVPKARRSLENVNLLSRKLRLYRKFPYSKKLFKTIFRQIIYLKGKVRMEIIRIARTLMKKPKSKRRVSEAF